MPSSLNTVTGPWGSVVSSLIWRCAKFQQLKPTPWGVGTMVLPILQMGELRLRYVEKKCLMSQSEGLKQVAKIRAVGAPNPRSGKISPSPPSPFFHQCRMSVLRGPPQSFWASSHSTDGRTRPSRSKGLPVSHNYRKRAGLSCFPRLPPFGQLQFCHQGRKRLGKNRVLGCSSLGTEARVCGCTQGSETQSQVV